MLRRLFHEGNSSKETGDNKNKSQIEHGQPVYDPSRAKLNEFKAKQSQDKTQQSDVGNSSDLGGIVDVPENFKHLGGNTELAKAKIILLGEAHIRQHNEDIVDFINTHAKSGDIVLVEGTQAGKKENKSIEELGKALDFGLLTNDEISQAIKEKGHKSAYREWVNTGKIKPFMKDIEIYGWDDIDAYNFQSEIRRFLLNKEFPNQKDDKSLEEKSLRELQKLDDIRNKKMLDTINNMRISFPNNKIFVVAGLEHVIENIKGEKLKNQSYTAITPTYEVTEKDIENYEKNIKNNLNG